MNIYVGNLSYNTTEEELKGFFSEHGEIASVNIIIDKYTGNSKGFAFVEMPNQSEAEKAIQALDGKEVDGRNIRVNQARPKSDRPRRRPRY